MIHGGCAITTPKPLKLAVADSCDDGVIAPQFDVTIVLFDYLCFTIEGLSVVGRCEFESFHDVASFLCSCSLVIFGSLSTVNIIAPKRSVVK